MGGSVIGGSTVIMKSTKMQNPWRILYCISCVYYYANARARKLATPRVSRGALSFRSHTG